MKKVVFVDSLQSLKSLKSLFLIVFDSLKSLFLLLKFTKNPELAES